ncbi:MAG: hypothetical protein R3F18_00345 [Lysobacterales bacterium]
MAGQQFVQQATERINVHRDAVGIAIDLLGGRVFEREVTGLGRGLAIQVAKLKILLQGLGDAEIQQLGLALGVHHDVAGFEIPMHHQLPMGVIHRRCNLDEQLQSLPQRQPARSRVVEYRRARDKFHGDIGRAIRAFASVDEPGDVGMVEPCKDPAFPGKTLQQIATTIGAADGLDGHALLDASVLAMGQVDTTHTACADQSFHGKTADAAAGKNVRLDKLPQGDRGWLWFGHALIVGPKQIGNHGAQITILTTVAQQRGVAFGSRQIDDTVKHRLRTTPQGRIQLQHSSQMGTVAWVVDGRTAQAMSSGGNRDRSGLDELVDKAKGYRSGLRSCEGAVF